MKYLLVILSILFVWTAAWAHEGHGFTHMTEPSGPLIGSRWCGSGILMWFHDDNEDNIVDRCSEVLLIHDRIHIRNRELINGKCICREEEVGL